MRKFLFAAVAVLLIFGAASCSSLSYYSQSVSGGLEVLWNRQDIHKLLAQADLDPALRDKLQLVLELRRFSIDTLALPDNDSYLSYTDLQREHVVWNVFAAPEFSLELKQWCFLFVGCVGYKGWFSPQDAEQEAVALRTQGFDVYTGGVDAYSTLGWFDDPLLNTFMNREDLQLAGLIFHELAHQVLYIDGDTAFNESFASTVEITGVRRWLESHGDQARLDDYHKYLQRRAQFRELIARSRARLGELYQQDMADDARRRRKAELIEMMRGDYAQLRVTWNGYPGYDRWFAEEINNAKLGSVALYNDLIPAFSELLRQQDGDFAGFYSQARKLAGLPPEERERRLGALSAAVTLE